MVVHFYGGIKVLSNKMFSKCIPGFIVQTALVLMVTSVLADQLDYQKEDRIFSPDPAEYQVISEEEAFELHVSEDAYEPSIIEEYSPIDGDVSPQTGSTVTFCNEADCTSVTVVFGGVSHPAYLSCYGGVLFYNIPAGTYAWSSVGCDRVSTGYLHVDGFSSYTIRICPSPTQECCLGGCLGNGAYGCWQCRKIRPATSSITTTTTTQVTSSVPSIPGRFALSGHVTGLVIADITVQLKGADSRAVVTNEYGYYEFPDLGNGYYTITPQAKEFVFEPQNYVVQSLSGNLSHMDFVARQKLQSPPCPLEIVYGHQSEEIKLLRYFRDNILNKTPAGREYSKLYSQWSPYIVEAMVKNEAFTSEVKEMIDGIMPALRTLVE